MVQGHINRLEGYQKDLKNWLDANHDKVDSFEWDARVADYANNAETLRILKGEHNPPKKED